MSLFVCRITALMLGLSLMVGESIRSWGQNRHFLAIIDDFLTGIALVLVAVLLYRQTVLRYCALCSAFAATSGMLYGSFTSKLLAPRNDFSSNIDTGILTWLIGLALFVSVVGLCLSLFQTWTWAKKQPQEPKR